VSELKMQGKIIIRGDITALTGLHIGGSPTGLEIGGVDNPVIKDHLGRPYIPGSSLKGKLRCLLERSQGLMGDDQLAITKGSVNRPEITMHLCNDENCIVCNIFGRMNNENMKYKNGSHLSITNATPPRLLVRDASLQEDSISDETKNYLDLEWTEVKWENSIDRITAAANPRQTERVPRGARFGFEMVYTVYSDQDRVSFADVLQAMKLLEDDYLGGAGSRGYGQVCFENIKVFWNSVADYQEGRVNLTTKTPLAQNETLGGIIEDLTKDQLQQLA
jgi:CRISPR-associated protein Csm3